MQDEQPWYSSPQFDPAAIDDPETRAFAEEMRRTGVAVIDLGEPARDLCDRAVADTEALFEADRFRRIQDAWLQSNAVRELATLPAIHDKLRTAYGREPFAFQTLNFRRGSEQALHSDAVHFNSLPEGFMCGVWIALEDVEVDAGPVTYIPGSHTLPRITMRDAGVARRSKGSDYGQFTDKLDEQLAESNLPHRVMVIPKGHAFVWAANLVHGGSPIARPGATRRSLVVHCYFENCLYYTPLTSDEGDGRLFVRVPSDVRTRLPRWPKRNGRPVMPSPGGIADALTGALLLRRPGRHTQ